MARSTGDAMGTVGEVGQAPTGSQARSETHHIHGGGNTTMPGDRYDGGQMMRDNALSKELEKKGGES